MNQSLTQKSLQIAKLETKKRQIGGASKTLIPCIIRPLLLFFFLALKQNFLIKYDTWVFS